MEKKTTLGVAVGTVLISMFAVICVLPLLYMVLVSFTDSESLYIRITDLRFNFSNYIYVLVKRDFLTALRNSFITVIGSCLLVNITSAMAAYGFEKKPVPGKEAIFQGYLATMMIPGQVTLIPMFVMINKAGLTNTFSALILPMAGAFGILLIRQFMASVPNDLLEAAEIDGCGEVRRFITIVIPLIQPALLTLTIFTFNAAWNNFLWPLIIITDPAKRVLPVTMSTLVSNITTNYGMVMAGATFTFFFPYLLYTFLQRQFIEGITLGGIKG